MAPLTERELEILSEALSHYTHAASYFNPELFKEAMELRKKLNELRST